MSIGMMKSERGLEMMAVESHYDSVRESQIVSGVHSAGCGEAMASDSSGSVVDAAHCHNLSHSAHASLFDLAHVASSWHDGSVSCDPFSWQHLAGHLGIRAALKFTILVSPACGHASSNVVN